MINLISIGDFSFLKSFSLIILNECMTITERESFDVFTYFCVESDLSKLYVPAKIAFDFEIVEILIDD